MNRLYIGLTVVLALILATAGTFFFLQKTVSFSVSFLDVKKLDTGDNLYLMGIPVGKVVEIIPANGKVRVGVHVDNKFMEQFNSKSYFFIDQDVTTPNHMCLLSLTHISNKETRLNTEDIVKGTDTALEWKSIALADKINNAINSESLHALFQTVNFAAQDLEKSIKTIDIDKYGGKFRSDIESLSREIDTALTGDNSKYNFHELQNQTERILEKLKRLENSEESRQLQVALRNFHDRLKEEIRKDENEPASHKMK